MSVTISSRHYFSILHVQAAVLFARQAAAIEQGYSGKYEPEVWTRDQCYVIGSVVSSAAFLEALINEIFADAAERHSGAKSGFSIQNVVSRGIYGALGYREQLDTPYWISFGFA